jgi:diacylglycerol kinase family enzyme
MPQAQPIAVLLNANAKRVNRSVLRKVTDLVPERDIFLSRDADEAEQAARAILRAGYPTVCTGGGDGTLVNFVTAAHHFLGEERDLPADIGVLKLGTGNAIASHVGAGEVAEDLRKLCAGLVSGRSNLPLIDVEGRLCHFAGLGLDAAIINDYNEIKHTWAARSLKYFASVLARSLPRQLGRRRRKPVVRVVNTGSPAFLCGPNGELEGPPLPAGTVLYEGPVTLIGASTTPYYGYGMRIYPFAGKVPGRMQLRVASSGVFEILSNLRALWKGTHRSRTIRDYWVDAVSLQFTEPAPFQIGGDAQGYRERVDFRLSARSVRLVDHRRTIVH